MIQHKLTMSVSDIGTYDKYYQQRFELKLRYFRYIVKLGKTCNICGESNPNLFEFAHYDREDKKYALGHRVKLEILAAEINKGRIICIWCHRLETKKENELIKHENTQKWIYGNDILTPDVKGKTCNGILCNGQTRHSSYFYTRKQRDYRISGKCKKCTSHERRDKRNARKEFLILEKLKIGKCQECNVAVNRENDVCFDYDHRNQKTKLATISNMIRRGNSINKILDEIKKCRLLCCKCHRLHTMKQLNHIDYTTFNYEKEIEKLNNQYNKYIPPDIILNILKPNNAPKTTVKLNIVKPKTTVKLNIVK